jgi:hypothetical protein
LAISPSVIPLLSSMQSTSTCIKIKYTTFIKLILRASNKVNGGPIAARCR